MKIKDMFQGKEIRNASWLISSKIMQMLLSLIVGMLTARYLGPQNYGLISYGMACVSFFISLCTLGINNIIVKEFIDNPSDQGVILGSTLVLRMFSSFFSIIVLNIIIKILDKDDLLAKIIVFLCSIGLFFQIFDTFNYWFQAQYQSKITAIATFIAYVITSGYKIILLLFGASTQWFAFASSLDYIVLGGVLYCAEQINDYQVPILNGTKDFKFPVFENGLKYDIFLERMDIDKLIFPELYGKKILDLYGSRHNYEDARYVISTRELPYKKIKSIGLIRRPIELNCIEPNFGKGIYVYDMLEDSKEHKTYTNYITRYDTRGLPWKRLLELGFISLIRAIINRIRNK